MYCQPCCIDQLCGFRSLHGLNPELVVACVKKSSYCSFRKARYSTSIVSVVERNGFQKDKKLPTRSKL